MKQLFILCLLLTFSFIGNAQLRISQPVTVQTYPNSLGIDTLVHHEAKTITFQLKNTSNAAIVRSVKLFIQGQSSAYLNVVWEHTFTLAANDSLDVALGGDCVNDSVISPAGNHVLRMRAESSSNLGIVTLNSSPVPCVGGNVACADVPIVILASGNTGCATNTENIDFKSNLVQIYPNPAENILVVELNKNFSTGIAYVRNITGQTIKTKSIQNQSQLEWEVDDLPSGTYFIQVISKDFNTTLPFIKQ